VLGTVTESDHQQTLVCCWENDHVTPPSVGRSTKYSNFVDCHRPHLATVSKLQLKQTNSVVACLLQLGNMQSGDYRGGGEVPCDEKGRSKCVFAFICGLFNYTVSRLDCTTSNCRMGVGRDGQESWRGLIELLSWQVDGGNEEILRNI
jgi:hypothetical protein